MVSRWNDHPVVLQRSADGQEGWPVCTELDPDTLLVPRLTWDHDGNQSTLRCEGHHPYQADSFSEAEALKALHRLQTVWPFRLSRGAPWKHTEQRQRLLEELAEAKSRAQRFLPLRDEFTAAADELEQTLRAVERGAGQEWREALEKAALAVATDSARKEHPASSTEIWQCHLGAQGNSLGTLGVPPEHEEARMCWLRTYREALLSPAKLFGVDRADLRDLREEDRPPILKWYGTKALAWAPEAYVLRHAVRSHVSGTVDDTPRMREMLPVLWDPDSTGALRRFQAAVEAVELL